MGTMEGWVTRERLRQEQEQAKIEQARKEGFDAYVVDEERLESEATALRARVAELEWMVRYATIRAQIAVLEEINDEADSYMDSETGADAHWAVKQSDIQDKIAALRKELEG